MIAIIVPMDLLFVCVIQTGTKGRDDRESAGGRDRDMGNYSSSINNIEKRCKHVNEI